MTFDAIADAYEILHPVAPRLAREGAFLARWAGAAETVLDVGCGRGAHAAHLARVGPPGRRVTACDPSPRMLERARAEHLASGVDFIAGDLLAPPSGPFARILVIGNTLDLLPTRAAAAKAFAALAAALTPDGSLLVHVINPRRAGRGPSTLVREGVLDGRKVTAVKAVIPDGARSRLLLAVYDSDQRCLASSAATLLDLDADEIGFLARDAGLRVQESHGGFDGSAFVADASTDVIAVIGR